MNCHKLRQTAKLLLIFFVIICDIYSITAKNLSIYVHAAVPTVQNNGNKSFSNQVDYFLNHRTKASKEECMQIFGKYAAVIIPELDLEKIYFVSYNEVEALLTQAAKESIDSLTLFTLPLLQDQKGFAIVFNEKLIKQINKNFNFHALFNIETPFAKDGYPVRMRFFVIGQGKLIVSYNRNATIKHPDYDFATGKYDYTELFIMDADKDAKGNPGLFNIKALSKPDGELRWMKGPLNVDIRSLIISSEPGSKRRILIQYNLIGIKQKIIAPIPIEKLYND